MKKSVIQMLAVLFLTVSVAIGADIVSFTFKVNGQPDQTFSVEMPDGSLAKAIEAFSAVYQRPEKVKDANGEDIDNPVTKPRFMAQKIREFCVEVTKAYSVEQARKKASDAATVEFQKLENSIQVK